MNIFERLFRPKKPKPMPCIVCNAYRIQLDQIVKVDGIAAWLKEKDIRRDWAKHWKECHPERPVRYE